MTGPRTDGDAPIIRDTLPDFGGVGGAPSAVSPLANSVLLVVGAVRADERAPDADADMTPTSVPHADIDDESVEGAER